MTPEEILEWEMKHAPENVKTRELQAELAKFTDLTPVVEALAKRGYPSLEAFFARALSVIGNYKPTR